jgi:hypothetical protein
MFKTETLVLLSGLVLLAVVLDLVRRRQLREEYSWLWLTAAMFYLVLAIKPELIGIISGFFGITNRITAFIFFGLFFIVLILIHYSTRLSKLTNQMKDVAQQIAILDGEQNKIENLLENTLNSAENTREQRNMEDAHQQVDVLESEGVGK